MKYSILSFLLFFYAITHSQSKLTVNDDLKTIDSLKTILKLKNTDSLKCITLFKLSDVYYKISDTDKNKLYNKKANKLIGNNKYLKDVSYFYNSFDFYLRNDNKNFLKQLLIADERMKPYNFSEAYLIKARIYRNQAVCYHIENNEKLALRILINSAIPAAKKSGNSEVLGSVYSFIGSISFNNEDYKNAEYYYRDAIKILEADLSKNGKSIVEAYLYYCRALLINNKKNEAKQALQKAGSIITVIEDNYLSSSYYRTSGYLYHHFEEYEKALLNYDKAQKFAERSNDQIQVYLIKTTKSNTLTELNRLREARDLLEEALNSGQATASDKIQIFKELARLSKRINDFPKAVLFFEALTTLSDSLEEIKTKKIIADLQVKFKTKENQDKIRSLEIEKRESEIKLQNTQLIYLLLGSLLIILFLITAFLWKNNKSQKRLAVEIEKNNNQNIINLNSRKELEIMQAMIEGEEKERTRLARDLHDGIGSRLSSLKMQMEQKFTKLNNESELKPIIDSLTESITELRTVAFNLVPEVLLKLGLELALRDLCYSMASKDVIIDFTANEIDPSLQSNHQMTIFRIVQELINNALKHADCTEIIVDCSQNNNLFLITVEDNGKGFNTQEIEALKGLGLRNIKNRVDMLNGNIDVKSKVNSGTIVNIELTIPKEEAE
jgi:signal transduction histidine kinase